MGARFDAATGINGRLTVPGDKSISHRAVMLGSIATGETTIYGLLDSDDVRNTLGAMQQLGVTVDWYDDRVVGYDGGYSSCRNCGAHGGH
ncbi:hypothetical protein H7R52_16985 [Weissella confusa]|uniref:Enolpyruvate transferase domain-containing protein n=1 Tax=Weissella confusa TaxID=1583 RepID=A0A923NHA7_WEICO|nr:hypothetical protein [Weissella confusa]